MPYFLLFEALAPVIEVSGYIAFVWFLWEGEIYAPFAASSWCWPLLGILNSLASVVLEEMCVHPYQASTPGWCFCSPASSRILATANDLIWRLRGMWIAARQRGLGHMVRKGIGPQATPPE